MKYTIFISVWLLLFGGCQKCKKEEVCLPVKADFQIGYYDYIKGGLSQNKELGFIPIEDGDTILIGDIYFKPTNSSYENYYWKIGTDPKVFRDNSLWKLGFPAFTNNQKINVQLKVKSAPLCKDDKGLDSLTKSFVPTTDPGFYGYWVGYEESEPNKPLEIFIKYDSTGIDEAGIETKNLPLVPNKTCFIGNFIDISRLFWQYKFFQMNAGSGLSCNCTDNSYYGFYNLKGYGDRTGKFIITYEITKTENNKIVIVANKKIILTKKR